MVGRGWGWQEVGIQLGSREFYPNFIPTGPVPNFCQVLLEFYSPMCTDIIYIVLTQIVAKLWNRPSWDKVGIEFTGSQLDPNFLPSLAPTNHPSVLVDISIFFYLKETLNKKLQTNCLHISLDYIPLSLHWLKWHHNS